MIRVGIAGIGFMGWIHYLAYQRVPGIKVVAFWSRDPRKRQGDWRGIQGNFGPPGQRVDVSQLRAYEHYEQMLDDPDIDLIDVCLPPHLHAEASIQAIQHGKHVFCEKPMALTVQDCQRMVRAAHQHGRQLLIGHVLPFFPEFARVLQWAEEKKFGQVVGGHFKRIISDPLWLEGFYDPQRIGGPLIDLHVHDAHFIRLLFGMPVRVTSQGRMRGEVVEYCATLFDFADRNLVVSAVTGVINQQGRPFTHGFEVHFEEATVVYESAVIGDHADTIMPLTLLDNKGKARPVKVSNGDPVRAFVEEVREVVQTLKTGKPSALLDGSLARDALVVCQKEHQSVVRGRPVRVV